jgi:hypothetical protein
MKISQRVKKLRDQSLMQLKRSVRKELCLLLSFIRAMKPASLSAPVKRAKAFEYLLKNKKICINEGELIVGERGPAPKETPTYPEISLHSMKDLEILNSREKVFFRVDDEVKNVYEKEIIPFWKDKSNRDRIMSLMTPEWLNAYNAGCLLSSRSSVHPDIQCWDTGCSKKGFLL